MSFATREEALEIVRWAREMVADAEVVPFEEHRLELHARLGIVEQQLGSQALLFDPPMRRIDCFGHCTRCNSFGGLSSGLCPTCEKNAR